MKEAAILPTCSVILDTRRANKDETYPLCLRVYNPFMADKAKNRRYYRLKKRSLTKEQYNRIDKKKLKGANPEVNHLRDIASHIMEVTTKAESIIKALGTDFTFNAFESAMNKNTPLKKSNSVYDAYMAYIEELNSNKQVRTAANFECALKSLANHVGGESHFKSYQFRDIDKSWLKRYEADMIEKDKSYTTISMYLRTLRQIFNRAIALKIVSQDAYPFGGNKYEIPVSTNNKRSLDKAQINAVMGYKATPASGEEYARDMWTLSYLCNGANLKDIARLKYKNIDWLAGEISFIRAKTVNKRNKKNLVSVISPRVRAIIERHGNKDKAANSYVFPILTTGMTAKQELYKLRDEIKYVNKHLQSIATDLKLNSSVKLTTMTARHSHATILKNAGVPVKFISESLGHSSVQVTENYLGSFTHTDRVKNTEALTEFVKE